MKNYRADFVAALQLRAEHPRPDDLTDANVMIHAVRRAQPMTKRRLLARVGPRCESCKFDVPDERILHLHHVVPVTRGGTNDEANTVLICPNCHALAHWLDRTTAEAERPADRARLLFALKQLRMRHISQAVA